MDTAAASAVAKAEVAQDRVVSLVADDPVALTARCLARIEARDARLGAMTHVDRAGAMTAAEASAIRRTSGAPLSPIDGLPIAIKANIAVAGWPWTAGIAAYADRRALRDATCVSRLRAAGAVLIGATNMDEGALGALGDNPWFGRTHNPGRHGFTAGGSSGGSAAAVAAGFAAAALGTDTIGSIRIPASYCGVIGHKPRRGAVAVEGVTPLSSTLDTVGILARDVAICRAVTALATGDTAAPTPIPNGVRIGLMDAQQTVDEPAIAETVARAADTIARAGGSIVRIDPRALPLARLQRLLLIVAEVEGAEVHRQMLAERPDGFSDTFTAMLAWGAGPGLARYEDARREIEIIAAELRCALAGIDALLTPATPQTAFAFDAPVPSTQSLFVSLASALGDPATAFPAGRSRDGLPIGVQVVAADGDLCLALAAQCGSSPPETFIDSAVM